MKKKEEIKYAPKGSEGRLHYVGSTKGGRPDGKGTMQWNNGRTYIGDWEDGLMHGYGCLSFEKEHMNNYY